VEQPDGTVVLTDFDGTLAPIVTDPTAVQPLPGATGVLARLGASYARVAVVSGRPVSFLAERLAGVPGVRLVGLYGFEVLDRDGRVVTVAEAERWRPVVAGVVARLEAVVPPGAWIESKGLTVTAHWRGAPTWGTEAAERVAAEASTTGLVAHAGRMSLELRPPMAVDKGSVVTGLASGHRAACFLGDDLGDLPAFAALDRLAGGGMATVSVAAVDAESAPEVAASATLAVPGPVGALAVLRWLADAAEAGGAAG
jgi:trehalose 6-phosphate phosphatase